MASILDAGSERIVRLLLQNNEVNEFNPAEKARAKGKQHISERWFKHIFNHAEIRGQIAAGYYCIVEDEKINHLRVHSKGGSYWLGKGYYSTLPFSGNIYKKASHAGVFRGVVGGNKICLKTPAWEASGTSAYLTGGIDHFTIVLSKLAFKWIWGWGWPCFDRSLFPFLMEIMLKKYSSIRTT